MNIDELTIGKARELKALFAQVRELMARFVLRKERHPYEIGKNYLIRTVTMTLFGELIDVHQQELVLRDAAWIANSGRWADALQSGVFDEVEPFPDGNVVVGRGTIVDAVALPLALSRIQK